MRIDEKTTIPLAWAVGLASFFIGTIWVITGWTKSIDLRLQRIEDRLEISQSAGQSFIQEATAAMPRKGK